MVFDKSNNTRNQSPSPHLRVAAQPRIDPAGSGESEIIRLNTRFEENVAELVALNAELIYQNREQEKRATELL